MQVIALRDLIQPAGLMNLEEGVGRNVHWGKVNLSDGACFKVANNHNIGTAVVAKGAVMNWDIDYDPTGSKESGNSATENCLAHSSDEKNIIMMLL